MATTNLETDPFKAKRLRCDSDAMILLALAGVLALAAIIGLGFLPDAAWDRIVQRSRVIWLAIPSVVAVIVAIHGRFKVRAAGAASFGLAAAAIGPEIARNELYAQAAAADIAALGPILPNDKGA